MKGKLSPQAFEIIAGRFRVLAEPVRLRLVDSLREGEMSVNELSTALGSSQPNVSKHLRILTDAGVLRREQRGNAVYYSVADQSIFRLCEVVCDSLSERLRKQAELFVTA